MNRLVRQVEKGAFNVTDAQQIEAMTHFTNEQFPPKSRIISKSKERKKKKPKLKYREPSPQKEEK